MPKLWAKGRSEAHQYACEQLSTAGFSILQAPDKTIDGVLLDVPSFRGTDLADIAWEELPENAIVIGGNLAKHVPDRFRCIDLLGIRNSRRKTRISPPDVPFGWLPDI